MTRKIMEIDEEGVPPESKNCCIFSFKKIPQFKNKLKHPLGNRVIQLNFQWTKTLYQNIFKPYCILSYTF